MRQNEPVNASDSARAEDEQSRVHRHTGPVSEPTRPDRDTNGRFTKGNQVALSTGFYAKTLPPEYVALRDEARAFLEGALVDEGEKPEDVPVRRRSLLEYRARIHRRILQLDAALDLRGMVDKRGKLRATWLQRFESLISTAKAIDSLLGLERRAKQLPGTPAQYLASLKETT